MHLYTVESYSLTLAQLFGINRQVLLITFVKHIALVAFFVSRF